MLHVIHKKAFIDANVLFPTLLRELLLRLADRRLIDLAWSDKVLSEWQYHITKMRRASKEQIEEIIRVLGENYPTALVTEYESLMSDLRLPDPDDLHVLAAAIKGECDYIVTFNMADFRKKLLRPHGLVPIHPQAYLLNVLEREPEGFVVALGEGSKLSQTLEMFRKRDMNILLARIKNHLRIDQ